MIYKKRSIDSNLENKIIELYIKGCPLDEIEKITNVSKSVLVYMMNAKYDRTIDDMASFRTYGDSILIVADTHIGSHKENLGYIDEAYDMGVKKGVASCIHLGDIIQGRLTPTDKTLEYQMDTLEKMYPEPDEFETYLLLGNHDYSVFEYYPYYKELLEAKKGLHPLGYRRVYFTWNDYLFGMEHKIKQVTEEILLEDCAEYFVGHGHELKIKTVDRLKAPTLSDDIMNQNNGAYPAFMIGNICGDELYVDVYNFDGYKAVLKKENYLAKTLSKKNKVK